MQVLQSDTFDIFPSLAARNAGIVHEAVKASKIPLEAKRECGPSLLRRDVQAPIMTAEFLRQLFTRMIEKIGDNDQGAFIRQAASTGGAKAARAAGYKNSFPGHSTGTRLIHLQ
jgi:hypothetical protein